MVVEEAVEEAASLTVTSDHAMEEDQRSSAADGQGRWGGFSFVYPLFMCVYCLFALFSFSFSGKARRGQGELPRAVGGLWEVAADGEQERAVYNIVMIQ